MRSQNRLLHLIGIGFICCSTVVSVPLLTDAQPIRDRIQTSSTVRLEFRQQRSGTEKRFVELMRQRASLNGAARSRLDQQITALFEPATLTNADIEDAYPSSSGISDRPWEIGIKFTPAGGQRFATVTKNLAGTGRVLGIFLNGSLISSPIVDVIFYKTGITGGAAVITGNFTAREAADLAEQLSIKPIPTTEPDRTIALARKSLENREYKNAIAQFTQAIALRPKQANLYTSRAEAYVQLQQWKSAIADYSSAITLDPKNVQLYLERARLYEQIQQPQAAIPDYEKVRQLEPRQLVVVVYPLFMHYLEQKQKQAALTLIDDLMAAVGPSSDRKVQVAAESNRALAKCAIEMHFENWAPAIATCNAAIRLSPNSLTAYYLRGNAAEIQGNFAQAQADYRKVLTIAPESTLSDFLKDNPALQSQRQQTLAYAYHFQALARYGLKDFPAAIRTLDQAVALNPKLAIAYRDRGIVYQELGQPEKAKRDLQKAAALFQQQKNSLGYNTVLNILFERLQLIKR